MARLEGKVALVTGGASGIGRAVVKRLAADGASVVAGDIDKDGLASLVGEQVAVAQCDVTSEADQAALVAFLASDDASFITGTLQLVDGGAHFMRYPDLFAPPPDARGPREDTP